MTSGTSSGSGSDSPVSDGGSSSGGYVSRRGQKIDGWQLGGKITRSGNRIMHDERWRFNARQMHAIRELYVHEGEKALCWTERLAIRRDMPFLKDGLESEVWKAWVEQAKLLKLANRRDYLARHPEIREYWERRMKSLRVAYQPMVEAFRRYLENPDLADKNGMAALYMPLIENAEKPSDVLQALNALRKIYGHDEMKIKVSDLDNPEQVRAEFEALAKQMGRDPEPRQLSSGEVKVKVPLEED